MRLAAILLGLLLMAGCAHRPGPGSWLDAGSTYAALNTGRFVEANPVLAWAPTPAATALASIALKHGAKHTLDAAGVDPAVSHRGVETAGMVGGGWNLALLAGAAYPVAGLAALVTGMAYLWIGR